MNNRPLKNKKLKALSAVVFSLLFTSHSHAFVESVAAVRGDSGGTSSRIFGDTFALAVDDHVQSSAGTDIGGGRGATVTRPGEVYANADWYVEGYQHSSIGWGFADLVGTFLIEGLTVTTVPAEIPGGPVPGANTLFGQIHMSLSGFFIGQHQFNVTSTMGTTRTADVFGVGTVFDGDFVDQVISINHDIPLNTTFNWRVSVVNQGASSYFSVGEANGGSNEDEFGHILQASWSLILGGSPVFNLPEGYYVNSADGRIVNNYFVSSVPVPAAAWLFLSGLTCLGISKRQRRKPL